MTPGVLVVGPIPPPIHGAARVTGLVVDNLRDAGVRTVVLDSTGSEAGHGLGHHLRRLWVHLHAAGVVLRRRSSLRAVYLGGAGGASLWFQVGVVAAARLAGVQVVFHHHSYAYLDRPTAAMKALVAAGGGRAVHVVLAPEMGRALQSAYSRVGRVLVCSNAGLMGPSEAGPTEAGPETRTSPTLVLGHLGNLTREKGLDTTLATMRTLLEHSVDVRLVLAGPMPHDDARNLVAQAQADLGDALEYIGPVPGDDVDAFHRRLDLLLFPSRYVHEAEPLVVLEASRWSVPTVASAIGCLPRLVPDPDRLVGTGADFASAALAVVTRLSDPAIMARTRGEVRAHFDDRRAEALQAHRELVDVLSGARV